MFGMNILREMNEAAIIEEILEYQRRLLQAESRDGLLRILINCRTSEQRTRLFAEADLQDGGTSIFG